MKIFIKAKPKAKENKIKKIDENHFEVWVKELARDDRANQSTIRLLADYFNVSVLRVSIISGRTSKNKIIEII